MSTATLLDLNALPGPNTSTKREALADLDPRFQVMLAEAVRVGWPIGYQDDLYVHDRRILEAHPDQVMVWALREMGTELFPVQAGSTGEARHFRDVLRYWAGHTKLSLIHDDARRPRFYLVGASGSLRRVSAERAINAIQVIPS